VATYVDLTSNMRVILFRNIVIYSLIFFSLSWFLYQQVPKPNGHYDADSYGYELIARNIQEHGDIVDPRVNDVAIQPLGYPLFISYIFKCFSCHMYQILIIQIILAWFTGLMLYALCWYAFNNTTAISALILYAACLGPYIYAQLLLAEIITVFLLVAFISLFIYFLQTHTLLLLSAIPLGLSLIFKPTVLLLPFCLVPLFIVKRIKWYTILLFFMITFTPMLIHMGANYHRFGYFQFAPLRSLNIYQVFLSKVIARVEGIPAQQAIDEQLQFTGTHRFDESGWEQARTLFWQYAYEHPGAMIYVWLQNMSKTMFGLYVTQLKVLLGSIKGGDHSFFAQKGSFIERMAAYVMGGTNLRVVQLLGWFEVSWSVIRYFLFLFGIVILWWRKQYALLFFCVAYISVCSIITGFDGCVRYRLPFEPILIMVAACTLSFFLFDNVQKEKMMRG